MVKDSARATCAMLEPLQEIRLIDHILEKHWKELHLLKVSTADLVTEVLPKFMSIFNTH